MRVKGTRVLPPSYNPSDAYRRTRDHRQQPPACGRFLRHVTSFLPVRDGVQCRSADAHSMENPMTPDDWLVAARTDADRRDLPKLKPLLDALADATRVLRAASWNRHAAGPRSAVDASDPATRPDEPR